MNNYKKLINNTLIFAIGNLGSKIIVFFLLPLYTAYLAQSEFGLVDLLTTTIGLLLPVITLSIFDSVFRFVMDKNYDEQSVLTNSLVVVLTGFVISLVLYPLFLYALPFDKYLPYFYTLLFFQSFNAVVTQYVRAKGLVKLFAFSGIINAIVLLCSNLVLLAVFHTGILGYLTSLIMANIFSSLLVVIKSNIYRDIVIKKINIVLIKEMLIYSIPLIPNSLMWWVMSLSDRYLILYFLGSSANGLYAVANKIPSVLTVVNSIFFQAWQMSAIEEEKSENKSKFFSDIFNLFAPTILIFTSVLLIFLKFIMTHLVASEYYEAWIFVPYLLLGVIFSSFSGFLGTNYIVAKKTGGVFKTSSVGAIFNIIFNIILIPIIGTIGAAISTMLSFLIIWLIRVKETKKFVELRINSKKILFTLIAINIQIGVMYINLKTEILFHILILIIILIINFKEVNRITNKIYNTINKKVKNI
ncbi:oligosaccharide flippase family protein [Planomicrobium chinense]|uniref:lipopolysaccharide biosynthesis protein n=1 Tax=Planococcus chinensis TaxID=272917 RepID=UPI001CC387C0|nr:polysaccharide biosynthesis C-terminal domain-containing protein [Planococcus chinensis]MBZ5202038.1 oligosaccharide flippase family protein [Planococcus chinensis]